jgi:hypothetical protein
MVGARARAHSSAWRCKFTSLSFLIQAREGRKTPICSAMLRNCNGVASNYIVVSRQAVQRISRPVVVTSRRCLLGVLLGVRTLALASLTRLPFANGSRRRAFAASHRESSRHTAHEPKNSFPLSLQRNENHRRDAADGSRPAAVSVAGSVDRHSRIGCRDSTTVAAERAAGARRTLGNASVFSLRWRFLSNAVPSPVVPCFALSLSLADPARSAINRASRDEIARGEEAS